jgi:hypothetical protein
MRPWIVEHEQGGSFVITAQPGPGWMVIASRNPRVHTDHRAEESRANAELIVRAVNAHDALVASVDAMMTLAHNGMVAHYGDDAGDLFNSLRVVAEARAALSAARPAPTDTTEGQDRAHDRYDCADSGTVVGCDDDECCHHCGAAVHWLSPAPTEGES